MVGLLLLMLLVRNIKLNVRYAGIIAYQCYDVCKEREIEL